MISDRTLENVGIVLLYIAFSVVLATMVLIKVWPFGIVVGIVVGIMFAIQDINAEKKEHRVN